MTQTHSRDRRSCPSIGAGLLRPAARMETGRGQEIRIVSGAVVAAGELGLGATGRGPGATGLVSERADWHPSQRAQEAGIRGRTVPTSSPSSAAQQDDPCSSPPQQEHPWQADGAGAAGAAQQASSAPGWSVEQQTAAGHEASRGWRTRARMSQTRASTLSLFWVRLGRGQG